MKGASSVNRCNNTAPVNTDSYVVNLIFNFDTGIRDTISIIIYHIYILLILLYLTI